MTAIRHGATDDGLNITCNCNHRDASKHCPSSPKTTAATNTVLRLNQRKKVSWKEGTVDNEFMQKKSSKNCCIFHKQTPFDEDDSEDEHDHDHIHDHDHHQSDAQSSSNDG